MFGNDFIWTTSDDEEFPKNQELCVVDTLRCAQKWVDHKVVDAISVPPSQKWPAIEKLNADCPKSEWQEGPNGQPQGPWQRTRVVYFVDLETMQKYTYASGTTGADICVREFRDRVRTMRRFRGELVYAIVTLGDTYMPTRWGGRQRPDFKIQRWIKLGGDGDPEKLPKPSPAALPPASTAEALDRFAENKKPETKPGTKATTSKAQAAELEIVRASDIAMEADDEPTAAQTAPKPNKRGVVKTNKKSNVGKPVPDVTFEEILGDELPAELK